PFIAARRALQMIAAIVVHPLAAIPVVAVDAAALIPAAMIAIVMAVVVLAIIVVTVIALMLHRHRVGAAIVMAVVVPIAVLGESLAQRRYQKRQGSGGDKKAFHGGILF